MTVGKTLITTINVGGSPQGIAINPAGTRIYVANTCQTTPSVIDPATNTVVATVPAGGFANGSRVNPSGTRVRVSNQTANTVTVIDATSNTVVATVPVGRIPASYQYPTDHVFSSRQHFKQQRVGDRHCDQYRYRHCFAPITAAGGIAINPTGTKLTP